MPHTGKNIVWLASYPKSGNTWMRIFLSNLLSGSSEAVDINALSETAISSNRAILDSYLGIHTSELTMEETDRLRPDVFRKFSEEKEGLGFIKTHEAWTINSMGKAIFPEDITKGVLYIIRNPLDIAISYAYHNAESLDKTIASLNADNIILCHREDSINIQTAQILKSWSDHVHSWTVESKLPVHIIRYEDMLERPYYVFKDAINFLGLKYAESDLISAISNSSFDRLRTMELNNGFIERGIRAKRFFRKGKSNEWKSVLSHKQINDIVKHHKGIMKKFGYLE